MLLATNDGSVHVPHAIRDQLCDVVREHPNVPFPTRVVELSLNQHCNIVATCYSFDLWPGVVHCCSFLGIRVSEDALQLHRLLTMEVVRASGVNLFHFDEAVLLMKLLTIHDRRLMPIDRMTLEGLYWGWVNENFDMQPTARRYISDYDDLVARARRVRKELDEHDYSKMSSTLP